MFFEKYQVGYLTFRSGYENKEKRDFFPALWSEMITIKPRFIYQKQKNELRFYQLIPESKVSFEKSCEYYLSVFNWLGIPNVVALTDKIIQSMVQGMH